MQNEHRIAVLLRTEHIYGCFSFICQILRTSCSKHLLSLYLDFKLPIASAIYFECILFTRSLNITFNPDLQPTTSMTSIYSPIHQLIYSIYLGYGYGKVRFTQGMVPLNRMSFQRNVINTLMCNIKFI